MGIAVWRVTEKPQNRSNLGHVGFRPEKNVCLPTQLGACSHPTGRSTVPYWCTIDVRTPWARHGVPTGPPGPRRAPTARRQLGPADFPRSLPGLGGPQLLLASARAIVSSRRELHRSSIEPEHADLGYISCCCVGRHHSKPKSKLTSPNFNMLAFGDLG